MLRGAFFNSQSKRPLIARLPKALDATQSNDNPRKAMISNVPDTKRKKSGHRPIKNHEGLGSPNQKSSYELRFDCLRCRPVRSRCYNGREGPAERSGFMLADP
jgi:hypothetical protein